jgi:serine/threonine protein phosphatase PrpC
MQPPSEPRLDAAMAVNVGRRAHQEDAVICDCPLGAELGLVVLADGMGGYRCGDVAGRIVLTEVFSELKLRSAELASAEADVPAALRRAAEGANACLRAYVDETPDAAGMGATLVAGVLRGRALHWISVGDSPLYLFRDGALVRLNEDHSFGSVMRAMVEEGRMDADAAARHPERTSLISVLSGGPVAHVDCPRAPFRVEDGDVLVIASDGLLHLDEAEIRRALRAHADAPATGIAEALMRAVAALDDPEQDNVSLAVVRIGPAQPGGGPALRVAQEARAEAPVGAVPALAGAAGPAG